MRSLSDLFRNFCQIGYVTDDFDAGIAFLEAKLGTATCYRSLRSSLGGGHPAGDGVDEVLPYVVVDGKPADEWVIDVALVNAGSTNLELIRPVSGALDLYRGAIRPGAAATFHHLGFTIDDFDEADAVVKAAGRSWAQFGSTGNVRFGYLDMTAELGHFVEVMEMDEAAAHHMATLNADGAWS